MAAGQPESINPLMTEVGIPKAEIHKGFAGKIHRIGGYALDAVSLGAVGFELNHASNEGTRAYVLGAVQEATHNSLIATAACTTASFAIEAAGSFGAARLLHTNLGSRVLRWAVKPKNPSVSSKPDTVKNKIMDAVSAFLAGSPMAVFRNHVRNTGRTKAEDRKTALVWAAGLTAATAPLEYYLASPIVTGWTKAVEQTGPEVVSISSLAVSGIIAAGTVIAQRRSWRKANEIKGV